MLTLRIETDNEAFTDDPGAECARLLRGIAKKLESGASDGVCMDANGNKVGAWELTP